MYHLMMNLPLVGTLGVAALLAGPLARLPIDLGAWLLDRWLGGAEEHVRREIARIPESTPADGTGFLGMTRPSRVRCAPWSRDGWVSAREERHDRNRRPARFGRRNEPDPWGKALWACRTAGS